MSIKLMTLVWDSTLDGTTKAVALAYADYAADDGSSIYPSIEKMARKTGFSPRTVQRCTKSLIDLKILTLVRKTTGAPGDTNIYRFVAANLPMEQTETGDSVTPVEGVTGDSVTPVRVTESRETGDRVTPYPSYNHQYNRERDTRAREKPAPAHQNGFAGYMAADTLQPIIEALKQIAQNSKPKILGAAHELNKLKATPEQIVGFGSYWRETKPQYGIPWPSQVVEFWEDYREREQCIMTPVEIKRGLLPHEIYQAAAHD